MYTQYLDLEAGEGKAITVWPVPYEATASFAKGTINGPQAILRASYEIETWDQELGVDLADLASFRTLPFFRPSVSGPEAVYHQMVSFLNSQCQPQNDFVLTLGGEHSIALAPITFYQQQYQKMVVLHLDAHADLRDCFQESHYSHACVMARVLDLGLPVISVGVRSLSQKEWQKISSAGNNNEITVFFAWDLSDPAKVAWQVAELIGNRPVYITFDVDVLDPSIMPGTGTPEPGGLSFEWLKDFWSHVLSRVFLVGMDVCEVSPLSSCGVVSESVAVKCVNKALASYLVHMGDRD
jgi:agmatinase